MLVIDYFGNVKWSIYLKTPENNRLHHWGDVMENKIYLPSRNFIDLPNEISQKIGPYFQNCYKKNSFTLQNNLRYNFTMTKKVNIEKVKQPKHPKPVKFNFKKIWKPQHK